jgi:predicted ATP-grasp superfamily ATP-dependent carboligase
MKKRKILIFEFVSGGGFSGLEIPSSLFCEGYSMLKSLIEDFNGLGFEITILLDKRIAFMTPYLNVENISLVDASENYLDKYKQMLLKSECCFIIAPEFSNLLYKLTEIATDHNKEIYSIGLEGIKLGSSKMNTYRFFKQSNIPTPETYVIPIAKNGLDLDFIYKKFDELNHSIIIKPEDGVGAESVFHINDESQISKLYEDKENSFDKSRTYILQKFIEGDDMSISLIGISEENRITPFILSINNQKVLLSKGGFDSQYTGGMTPSVNFKIISESLNPFLQKLDLSHFKGYFGIDFILTPKNLIQFIEINPRLTTSYLGIRNIYDANPLKAIINPIKQETEKLSSHLKYFSEYFRLDLNYIGKENVSSIRNKFVPKILKEIPEMLTPPISLDESHSNRYSCFIATKTRDLPSSRQRKSQIIEYLKKTNFIQSN